MNKTKIYDMDDGIYGMGEVSGMEVVDELWSREDLKKVYDLAYLDGYEDGASSVGYHPDEVGFIWGVLTILLTFSFGIFIGSFM